jgi:TRAP-type C4-dicarboxylate transport system substrate-binding protein
MFTNRLFYLLIVFTLLIVTACAPQIAPTSPPASVPVATITLRFAVADEEGHPSDPFVREFIEQVKTLSHGNITVEPVWDAGADTEAGFERGVIQLVRNGEADLGLAASRAWDPEIFPNLQALQAPFLITDDALAEAVATSDVATRIIDSLSPGGVVGLTLWPEDLRHPFSVDSAKPLLSPEDFAGLNIRTTDTGVSEQLMKALGGNPIFEASDYQGAESGLLQGATLTGRPAATGNVVFFPKYQILFANGTAFEKLSEEQRNVLRQAATATQSKALAERPSEEVAGAAWCDGGGTIVLANENQVAAFETAGQPVYDTIAQEPSNAELIAAIRDLKTSTQPAPSAQACAPEVAQPGSEQSTDTQVWSEGLPPNGVWQVQLTSEDVIKLGVSQANAPDWSGIFTHTFQDGVFHTTWEGTEGQAAGKTGSCDGTYEVVEDFVRITLSQECGGEVDDIKWRLDEDGLHFLCIAVENGMSVEVKALFNAKPYQKIADP